MPTVLRVGPYRFFFYASDRAEPVHVHVEGGDGSAKFWLAPVRLHASRDSPDMSYLTFSGWWLSIGNTL
jgi:Domain of unknown function (DUF4160)